MNDLIQMLSDHDKLPAIVIILLFLLISRYISSSNRKNENMEAKLEEISSDLKLLIEERHSDLMLHIESTKSCVVKMMYDLRLRPDRRYRDRPVAEDRRQDDLLK